MRFVLLFALAASAGFTVLADDSQFIVVNTETKTTEPVFPTVNVNYNQSIAIRVVNKKDFKGTTKIFIAPRNDVGAPPPKSPPAGFNIQTFRAQSVTVTDGLSNAPDALEAVINFQHAEKCPSDVDGIAVIPQAAGTYLVETCKRTAIAVWVQTQDSKDAEPQKIGFPIQLEIKPWLLEFSAGFAITADFRAAQYSIVPGDAAATTGIVTQTSACGWSSASNCALSYRPAAYVHLVPTSIDWLAASFGVATDIPVTGLTLMLGPSIRLRTYPVLNDAFITLGASFGRFGGCHQVSSGPPNL